MKRVKIIEWIWIIVVVVLFVVSIKMVRSGELEAELASFGVLAPIVLVILKMGTPRWISFVSNIRSSLWKC